MLVIPFAIMSNVQNILFFIGMYLTILFIFASRWSLLCITRILCILMQSSRCFLWSLSQGTIKACVCWVPTMALSVALCIVLTVTMENNRKRKMEIENHEAFRQWTKKAVCMENSKQSKNGTRAPRVAPLALKFGTPTIVALTVAVIDTKNLFGVAITDAAGQYPHNLDYYPNHHGGNSSRWCRTEFLFNLGRFIPPIMLVSVQ